jgi:hypothetical protein
VPQIIESASFPEVLLLERRFSLVDLQREDQYAIRAAFYAIARE